MAFHSSSKKSKLPVSHKFQDWQVSETEWEWDFKKGEDEHKYKVLR